LADLPPFCLGFATTLVKWKGNSCSLITVSPTCFATTLVKWKALCGLQGVAQNAKEFRDDIGEMERSPKAIATVEANWFRDDIGEMESVSVMPASTSGFATTLVKWKVNIYIQRVARSACFATILVKWKTKCCHP
jgi:hypothetical protein